jgi:3-oxoacyl-[acyl-carrier-protein] synthase II
MNRVVITGVGAVTPFGQGAETMWASLTAGENGIRRLRDTRICGEVCCIGGELPVLGVADVCRRHGLTPPSRPPADPMVGTFFAAVAEAVSGSGLDVSAHAVDGTLGVAIADRQPSPVRYLEQTAPLLAACWSRGAGLDEARFFEELQAIPLADQGADPDSINHYTARFFRLTGPQLSIGTACASGNSAIGEAMLAIRFGDVPAAIVGGAYALDISGMIGFTRLGALTPSTDPDVASRPFDARRDGFVMGSGCGVLVLESLEHARSRGAPVLAEVRGYGASSDAFRATDPDPEARGCVAAIQRCLDDARLDPRDIDAVSAHGTSTVMNDLTETVALKQALGSHAYQVPVSSTKSMLGHSIMAAGALEAIVAVMTLRDQVIHPTRNLVEPDPRLDLDFVPGEARPWQVRHVLSNSFGFGGINTCLILSSPRAMEPGS